MGPRSSSSRVSATYSLHVTHLQNTVFLLQLINSPDSLLHSRFQQQNDVLHSKHSAGSCLHAPERWEKKQQILQLIPLFEITPTSLLSSKGLNITQTLWRAANGTSRTRGAAEAPKSRNRATARRSEANTGDTLVLIFRGKDSSAGCFSCLILLFSKLNCSDIFQNFTLRVVFPKKTWKH